MSRTACPILCLSISLILCQNVYPESTFTNGPLHAEVELKVNEQGPKTVPQRGTDLEIADNQSRVIQKGKGKTKEFSYLNFNFAHHPKAKKIKGVIGEKSDHWNFIDYGQTSIGKVLLADGTATDIVVKVSENDGEWGIAEQSGIFHGYIYHNCQCVDLSLILDYLPAGIYEIYVFAHGDAPDQNAAIEIESDGVTLFGKRTLNDGTWKFRSENFEEGNQYVRYVVDVAEGSPVKITSKRDGSNYSMFNAIQMKRIDTEKHGR